MDSTVGNTELLSLTADIVSSHVSNNSVAVSDLPGLISNVYASLAGLGTAAVPEKAKQEPAVSVRSSIKPDYIVCLEDGKKLKMLKRHLMTSYGMTPDAYRAKWSLPADYPMVAPNYAERRRNLAIRIGLGNKRTAVEAPAPAPEPKTRGRRKLAVAAPKD
ncbi:MULTISPECIES: MucR family transcriptional regulator [Sphingosinicellaceae]|uniref:MucR family transcriptional regulator n=1 Tax=Sphingosinicellaceae TaxID=2820280 RepID=UPI001C1E320F|nr:MULTISPECIES: MucR family transcriptional regulator [Polymorphobacter]QYE34065.1 MucR family transcriptional regulator [Polymorphobacter sp. PAMC 29334]UAJ09234.1 MucR family transcriptional regulator [Polymorphobacter megasporae]